MGAKFLPAFLTVVAAAAALGACVPVDPSPRSAAPSSTEAPRCPGPAPGVARDDSVEFEAVCDESGCASHVRPATVRAKREAARMCARLDEELDNAPWPEGVRPLN